MFLLFFFRFLPCNIVFSYVLDLHTCRILTYLSVGQLYQSSLKWYVLNDLYSTFFVLTVHVEPTEDNFSLDLMFRSVNINVYFLFCNNVILPKKVMRMCHSIAVVLHWNNSGQIKSLLFDVWTYMSRHFAQLLIFSHAPFRAWKMCKSQNTCISIYMYYKLKHWRWCIFLGRWKVIFYIFSSSVVTLFFLHVFLL